MLRKLTGEAVEAATGDRKKQQVFIWDTSTAGLGLRVTRTGKKAWVYRYSIDGRERRMTLKRYPDMDLATARQRAVELRAMVDRREDPAEKDTATTGRPTLRALWRKFEKKYLPRRSRGHQRNLRDAFERLILPHLGKDTPLDELTWEDVDDWHQELADRGPTQANRALSALSVAIKMAKKWKLMERGTPNPADDHEKHPERKPGRPFRASQLKAIGKALEKEDDPIIRTAITAYLLSGLRPGEICRLRWEDLQDDGIVELPETKTGARYAILSTRAARMIRDLPRVSEWIFPGRSDGEPLGGERRGHGLDNAWKRIRSRAKLKKKRCYDARHNWISTAAGLEIGDDIRRLLTGHAASNGGAHGRYLHVTELLRPAADRVADKIAEQLGL